jgi:hypothetical protein
MLTLLLQVGTSWRCGDGLFLKKVSSWTSQTAIVYIHSIESSKQDVKQVRVQYITWNVWKNQLYYVKSI